MYQQTLRQAPDNLEALVRLGICQIRAGDFASAVTALSGAAAITANSDPTILRFLAQAYSRLGKNHEALETARLGLRAADLQNNQEIRRDLEEVVRACSSGND